MTVKIRVEVFIPNSAERRSIIKGPNEILPILNGPSLKISHDRAKTIVPGISLGALIANSLDGSLTGKTIDKNPMIKDSTIKNDRDRHQIRIGNRLKNVIKRRRKAIEILQVELAKIGVNKNKRTQESLIRGSIIRSQLDLPETY